MDLLFGYGKTKFAFEFGECHPEVRASAEFAMT
jgi:hypothetical protein